MGKVFCKPKWIFENSFLKKAGTAFIFKSFSMDENIAQHEVAMEPSVRSAKHYFLNVAKAWRLENKVV
jgi:hypothetical protein